MRTITIEISRCVDCPNFSCQKRLKCIRKPPRELPKTCPVWLAAEKAKKELAERIQEVASESTKA